MPAFAQAELKQIGRKMACNEYFGASLAVMPVFARTEMWQIGRKMLCNEYFGASLSERGFDYDELSYVFISIHQIFSFCKSALCPKMIANLIILEDEQCNLADPLSI